MYKDTMIYGVCVALAVIPLCGQIADAVPAYIYLPIVCALRGILAF